MLPFIGTRHLVKATEVTAGLAESNGSLLLGIWRDSLHVTCGLTACTPGSAPGPTLGNECGKTLPFYLGICGAERLPELRTRTARGLFACRYGGGPGVRVDGRRALGNHRVPRLQSAFRQQNARRSRQTTNCQHRGARTRSQCTVAFPSVFGVLTRLFLIRVVGTIGVLLR